MFKTYSTLLENTFSPPLLKFNFPLLKHTTTLPDRSTIILEALFLITPTTKQKLSKHKYLAAK